MARRPKENEQEFEDLSSYSSAKDHKKPKKSRKGRLAVQIAAIAVCVLLIIIGGVMIYISTNLLEGLTTKTITKDPEKLGISSNAIMDESITNIALFGVDSRNTINEECLSDVIMILTVDNKHRKIKMTSILRDSRVPIEGETLTGEYLDWNTKINAAYYYGGPELAIRTLNQNFGLRIEDYVTVNFANMAVIVDAFGGVNLELTAEEVREVNKNLWALSQEVEDQKAIDAENGVYDAEYPGILREDFIPDASGELNVDSGNYVGGVFHLNGNQAVAYGRIRNVGTDFARVDRQHKVLSGLIGRLTDMGITDYPGLIKEMMPYCETSLELNDIVSLAPILVSGFTIESIKVPDIKYETDLYDGEAEDGIYYLVYDVTAAAERMSSFIFEEGSPYWEKYGNTADSSAAE